MSRSRNIEEEILIQAEVNGVEDEGRPLEDTTRRIKTRHILAFLGFLGFANVYAMRVNLSIAIVAMANSTASENESNLASSHSKLSVFSPFFLPRFHKLVDGDFGNGSHGLDVCPKKPPPKPQTFVYLLDDTRGGEFHWDERTQGLILGAFFYGYVATQIPGGRLSELFGGRHVFGLGVLFTGIFTLLSPVVVRTYNTLGVAPFLILRIFEGLAEGVTFPAMMAMIALWVPPLERSRMIAFVYAGALFGTVISMPLSGILCDLNLPVYWWLLGPGGWALAFYIFGVLGVFWYIVWMILVSDSPATHPYICSQERLYIEHSLKYNMVQCCKHRSNSITSSISEDSADNFDVPWCHLLTSIPLWAILLTMSGQSWAFYTLLTELPTYMDKILHYSIMQNSFLSTLPYLLNWLCSMPLSFIADYLLSHGYLSTATSMKVFNSIAVVVPSLSFIGIAYAGCHSNFIVFLLAISGAFAGASFAGVQVNHLALSPRFAGTLYGITNSVSNACGFLAPYAIGNIINGKETITRWRYVFLLSGAINLVANLIYVVFASGEVQPWDHLRPNRPNTSDQHISSEHSVNENREEEDS